MSAIFLWLGLTLILGLPTFGFTGFEEIGGISMLVGFILLIARR